MPEGFPDHALYSIAIDGIAGRFHADREAESRMTEGVRTRDHQEQRVGRADPLAMDGVELRLVGEAALPRQAGSSGRGNGA